MSGFFKSKEPEEVAEKIAQIIRGAVELQRLNKIDDATIKAFATALNVTDAQLAKIQEVVKTALPPDDPTQTPPTAAVVTTSFFDTFKKWKNLPATTTTTMAPEKASTSQKSRGVGSLLWGSLKFIARTLFVVVRRHPILVLLLCLFVWFTGYADLYWQRFKKFFYVRMEDIAEWIKPKESVKVFKLWNDFGFNRTQVLTPKLVSLSELQRDVKFDARKFGKKKNRQRQQQPQQQVEEDQ